MFTNIMFNNHCLNIILVHVIYIKTIFKGRYDLLASLIGASTLNYIYSHAFGVDQLRFIIFIIKMKNY